MNLFILIYFKFFLFFSFFFKKYCSFNYKYSHFKYFPPEKINKNNNNNIFFPISINYEKILICGSNHNIIFDRNNITNNTDVQNLLKFKYSSDFKYYNFSNKIVVACDENYLLIEFNNENLNENKTFNYEGNDYKIYNNNTLAKCELSKDSNRFRKNQMSIHNFSEYIISAANVDGNGKNKKYFIAIVSNNNFYSIHFDSIKAEEDEDENSNSYSESSNSESSNSQSSNSESNNSESSNSESSNSESSSNDDNSINSENIFSFKEHLKIKNNKKEKIITSQFINDDNFYILTCHVEGKGHYKNLNFTIYYTTTISHNLIWQSSILVKNEEYEYCYEFRNIELFKLENNYFSLMYECYHQNKLNFINIYTTYKEITIINVSSFYLPFIKPNTYRHCIDNFTFPIFCAFYDFDNDKNILYLYGFKHSKIINNVFHIEGYFHHEIYDFNNTIINTTNNNNINNNINLFIEANYSDLIIGVEDEKNIHYARIKYPVCNDFENFFKSNVDRHFYQYEIAENGMIFSDEKEMQIHIDNVDTNNENACDYRLSKTKDEITIFGKNHQKCKFTYSLIPKISADHEFLTDHCEIKYQNCPENCYNCETKEKCDQCKPHLALDGNGDCLCDKSLNIWIKKDGIEICLMPNNNLDEQNCIDNSYLNIYTKECVNKCDENGYSMVTDNSSSKKICKCPNGKYHFENKCITTDNLNLIIENSKVIDCSKIGQLYYEKSGTKKCVASCEKEYPNYHPINGICVACNSDEYITS